MRRILLTGLVIFSLMGFSEPAKSADPATDRQASVEMIRAKYLPILEAQHTTLLKLRETMKVDAGLLKQVKSVISDFEGNYAAIIKGLDDPNQAIQPIIDLCEEEVEEFTNSIYQLKVMAKKIKTIS